MSKQLEGPEGVRRKRGEVEIGGAAFWIWEVNVAEVET
jgi:hypothetical protein